MPRVLCRHPDAPARMGGFGTSPHGIVLEPHAGGMLTEEVGEDVAAWLAGIPGYERVEEPKAPAAEAKADEAPAEAKPPHRRQHGKAPGRH